MGCTKEGWVARRLLERHEIWDCACMCERLTLPCCCVFFYFDTVFVATR